MGSYAGKTKIAIYDMDRTITRKPTYIRFLVHAAWQRRSFRLGLLPLIPMLGLLYAVRVLNRTRLKELCQHVLLGPATDAMLIRDAASSFAIATMQRGVFADALRQIEADRSSGHRLVLATASYRYYTAEIARLLKFDDVVATRAARDDTGQVLARVEGVNCYGAGKFAMVKDWMTQQGLDRALCDIRFYSDHVSDRPLFEWSHHAFAVNPDPRLAVLTRKRGWPLLRWR